MHRRQRTDRIVERLTQLAEAHARAVCLLGEIVSAFCEDYTGLTKLDHDFRADFG